MQEGRGNLSGAERIGSVVLGLGLTALAARRGGPVFRLIGGAIGSSLIGRGFAGHCAMKAALTGQSTFKQGVVDQWQRTSEMGRRVAQRVAESTRKNGHATRSSPESLSAAASPSRDAASTGPVSAL